MRIALKATGSRRSLLRFPHLWKLFPLILWPSLNYPLAGYTSSIRLAVQEVVLMCGWRDACCFGLAYLHVALSETIRLSAE